jgi:hypothetical protein
MILGYLHIPVDSGEKKGLSSASKQFKAAEHWRTFAILRAQKIQEMI